jgi:hypothetical protein
MHCSAARVCLIPGAARGVFYCVSRRGAGDIGCPGIFHNISVP